MPTEPDAFARRTFLAAGGAAVLAGCGGDPPGPARGLPGTAAGANAPGPVVLLGDSVFDNGGYVAGGKSTGDH